MHVSIVAILNILLLRFKFVSQMLKLSVARVIIKH